ncbi:MAG: ABC transporter ATP-binding protein [Saprospiraceae bacterium]|nr:ABC transporter ATP-binding protein [Saprospiraceae bacterium]
MIKIAELSKSFGKLNALKNISMELLGGQLTALIGPNGSGKTTLIKSILSLVKPTSGRIEIQGKNIGNDDNYRTSIGYMPQIGRFPDHIKVYQIFDLLKNIRKIPDHMLDEDLYLEFNINSFRDKAMGTLSGGMRQKVNAAIAFLFNPRILILDEPTSGLDPISSEILKNKISTENKKGKLVILSSHILSDIDEITTHVAYMQEGNLIFNGSFEDLQLKSNEIKLGKAIAYLMRSQQSNITQ